MGDGPPQESIHVSDDERDFVSTFIPREDLIVLLTSLDFTRNAAIKALFFTGNHNADEAAGWLLEHSNDPSLNQPLDISQVTIPKQTHDLVQTFCQGVDLGGSGESDDSDELPPSDAMYKMVFVVNTSLNMGLGKTCAQVAHAAVALHKLLLQRNQEQPYLWEKYGVTKVTVRGESTQQLDDLHAKARDLNIASYLVYDAGYTQVDPGSKTVLGLFGQVSKVDLVSGSLKLL